MNSHLSITDLAIVLGAIIYIIMQVKDYRPIRSLRQENAEMRQENVELRAENDELRTRLEALEKKYDMLERSRDFEAAFKTSLKAIADAAKKAEEEHEKIVDALVEIKKGLAANTTALSALAAGLHS